MRDLNKIGNTGLAVDKAVTRLKNIKYWGIADEDKELWKVSPETEDKLVKIVSKVTAPSLPNWTMERRRSDVEEHGPDSPWAKCFLTEEEYISQGRPSGWYSNVGVFGSLTRWYENAYPKGLEIMKDKPAAMKYLSVEAWKDMVGFSNEDSFEIFKADECPCGGPKGHVPNGMNCRKVL